MDEILERIIVGESRHYFIYSENKELRKELLQNISDRNPIVLDSNEPAIVYMDDFALPESENKVTYLDNYRLKIVSREYLSFYIVYKLLIQFQRQTGIYMADLRIKNFLKDINRLFLNQDYNDIEDLNGLINVINQSKEFYKREYKNLQELGKIVEDINVLPIQFLELNSFMRPFKKMINTTSHFSIVFDQQSKPQLIMQQAINSLVTKRINSDISVNVVCERNEWKTYYDLTGMLAEPIHDYGDINIEDFSSRFQKIKTMK